MKDGFETFRERLDNIQVTEAVPGFNLELVWSRLHPGLARPKRPAVWKYAAAVLLGLLIGAAGVRMWDNQDNPALHGGIVSRTLSPQVPAIAEQRDTIAMSQHDVDTDSSQNNELPAAGRQRIAVNNAATPNKYPQGNAHYITAVDSASPGIPVQVAVEDKSVAKATNEYAIDQAPVVHLLDIDNEDRKTFLRIEKKHKGSALAKSIIKRHLPENYDKQSIGPDLTALLKN